MLLRRLVRWIRSLVFGGWTVAPQVKRIRRIRIDRLRRALLRLPGMHPNAPKRNVIVFFLYAYLLVFAFFL